MMHSPKTEISSTTLTAVGRHPDELLTSVELARVLKVSDRAPENWRQNGDGPPYIRAGGRRILYRWSDVLEWLDQRRYSSTSEEGAAV
jgi:predicted DNA-binding transcriptional regulator AlpA